VVVMLLLLLLMMMMGDLRTSTDSKPQKTPVRKLGAPNLIDGHCCSRPDNNIIIIIRP